MDSFVIKSLLQTLFFLILLSCASTGHNLYEIRVITRSQIYLNTGELFGEGEYFYNGRGLLEREIQTHYRGDKEELLTADYYYDENNRIAAIYIYRDNNLIVKRINTYFDEEKRFTSLFVYINDEMNRVNHYDYTFVDSQTVILKKETDNEGDEVIKIVKTYKDSVMEYSFYSEEGRLRDKYIYTFTGEKITNIDLYEFDTAFYSFIEFEYDDDILLKRQVRNSYGEFTMLFETELIKKAIHNIDYFQFPEFYSYFELKEEVVLKK